MFIVFLIMYTFIVNDRTDEPTKAEWALYVVVCGYIFEEFRLVSGHLFCWIKAQVCFRRARLTFYCGAFACSPLVSRSLKEARLSSWAASGTGSTSFRTRCLLSASRFVSLPTTSFRTRRSPNCTQTSRTISWRYLQSSCGSRPCLCWTACNISVCE